MSESELLRAGSIASRGDLALARWEGCTAEELAASWEVPRVHLFGSVDSTNDIARMLAEQGAPAGTVVLAEEQRRGRGRVGRAWSSPADLGLWLSMIARPNAPEEAAALPLRVAAAVAAALEPFLLEEPIGIKWPNDLLIRGKKVGGILCESSWSGPQLGHVIIGIGINLLHAPDDFPEEIRGEAISLRIAACAPISRFEAASGVVAALRRASSERGCHAALHVQLERRDVLRNRRIQVMEPGSGREVATGVACGISEEGALLVHAGTGPLEIRSGTVRLLDRGG